MNVLLIGATGMLGRPVARRLVREGFGVRAMVRDPARAAGVLPPECELVPGDLREPASIESALRDVDAAYLNFSHPYSPRTPFDPDRDGTAAVLAAAKGSGLPHILRISALGTPQARDEWWLIGRKAATDQAVADSGIPFTIFRPTWIMESLAALIVGPAFLSLRLPRADRSKGLHWISGDDYAGQVAAALRTPTARGRIYAVQGPESVSLADAGTRFAAAFRATIGRTLVRIPVPVSLFRVGGLVAPKAAYMANLMAMTMKWTTRFEADDAWRDLGRPSQSIEDYAASILETGDLPRK